MEKINVIIYSLSADREILLKKINNFENDFPVLLLSPHKLFDLEQKDLKEKSGRELIFKSFYEFINEDEMVFCDLHADELILEKYGDRKGKLSAYYEKIKELKNGIILGNLKKSYDPQNKILLSDDLGIYKWVWLNGGFENKIGDRPGNTHPTKSNFILKIIKKFFSFFSLNKITFMETEKGEKYLFWGRYDRTKQYLDEGVQFKPLNGCYRFLLSMMMRASTLHAQKILGKKVSFLLYKLFYFPYLLLFGKRKLFDFISPIHEDDDNFGILAHRLGVKMFYMQDGHLPKFYPSAYLKYRLWCDGFHIWDKLSNGIFDFHGLNYEIKDYFRPMKLPQFKEKAKEVKNVLFLASGAGDWTALKNRTDEDLAFEYLLQAAKERPDIKFIFRPHPLWEHPKHQGLGSIRRVRDYSARVGLKNFFVSDGCLKEGTDYAQDKNVSRKPKSIKLEIEEADIVFGAHSQTILNSLHAGKIACSVNVSQRKSFFCNYTDIGFPLVESVEDILEFIKKAETGEAQKELNDFIDKYNKEYTVK